MLLFCWQVIHAARTLAAHPVSKIAQENMEVFVDVWEAQVEELGKVLRLITAGGDPSKSKCARQCTLIYCFFFLSWIINIQGCVFGLTCIWHHFVSSDHHLCNVKLTSHVKLIVILSGSLIWRSLCVL